MKEKLINLLKVFTLIALVILSSTLASEIAAQLDFRPLRTLTREVITCLTALILFVLFALYWDKKNLRDSVLLKEKQRLISWLKGCMVGIVMIGLTMLVMVTTGWIEIERSSLPMQAALFPFVTMLFTAFWEELVFRGYALNKLQYIIGKHTAAIAVALIFALLHLLSPLSSPQIVISTFLSGLLLNYAFLQRQSLYFPIGIHFAWNALNNFFFGKDLFQVDYVNELMGGIENPEQGIVAIVITGLAWLAIISLKPAKKIF